MDRWQLVQELFEETAGLDAGARARVLRERGGSDAELAREVERLVAADGAPLGELDRSATDLLQELAGDEAPAAELIGASFGDYRVEEHLASGGMAHVYRAARTVEGAERRVALKVLRPGLDGAAFLERFRAERRTLAALEHEHVVAFLDAGALPDGRPFLAMELVQGRPLTVWAREVPRRRRLELFLQVLAAVQYAHQKLVVHRDLKPSNVLVTDQGAPKLLDFGVAGALAAHGAEDAAPGIAPLTPSYASPEELRGEPATTAADVYSLGVLLHELLTGELPRGGRRRPGLDADLAAIVARALEREPARRYRSADQLADDLRRWLAREPVSARRAAWPHRAALLAQRHRGVLLGTLALLLALAAGWVGSDLARRRAQEDAAAGWQAHAQARVVARLLGRWTEAAVAADPALGAGLEAHLEAALAGELAALPEAETLVRLALAERYLAAGDPARAAPHAARALELARTTRGVGRADRERAEELVERTRDAR